MNKCRIYIIKNKIKHEINFSQHRQDSINCFQKHKPDAIWSQCDSMDCELDTVK